MGSLLCLPPELLVTIASYFINSPIHEKGAERGSVAVTDALYNFMLGSSTSAANTLGNQKCVELTALNQVQRVHIFSMVCKRFYAILYHPSQDVNIWRPIAIKAGLDRTLSLAEVLRCRDSSVYSTRRTWRAATELVLAWDQPFPAAHPSSLGRRKSYSARAVKAVTHTLPSNPPSGVLRSFDLVCTGPGRVGPWFVGLDPVAADQGKLLLRGIDTNQDNLHQASNINVVISPTADESQVLSKFENQDLSSFDFLLPNQPNLVMEESTFLGDDGEIGLGYEICRYSAATGLVDAVWRIPDPPPERFVARGDTLLALYSPTMVFFWAGSPDNPAQLRCFKSVPYAKRTTRPSGFSTSYSSPSHFFQACSSGASKLMWSINLSRDWAHFSPSSRSQYCIVRNIAITARHAIVLVLWYPTSSMHKLSGTSFRVLDLSTGDTENVLQFKSKDMEDSYRPTFTTISDHPFLVTDTHIISGGPNGRLYVWNYQTSFNPLYVLPDPYRAERQNSLGGHIPPLGSAGVVSPMITSLAVSVDGKYVSATTSNRITVWDMISKKVHGVYINGRKIPKRDVHIRNPLDSFPTGIWILIRDWKLRRRNSSLLEKLLSDDESVEEYALVGEKFTYVIDPLKPIDSGGVSWISKKQGHVHLYFVAVVMELINFVTALYFWLWSVVHDLLVSIWSLICGRENLSIAHGWY
ncbi:uncharacterized protein V1516DRAFT_671340 [Lipomyces oligophaga]|uniref:uncharacterized protein n=1 Tax=Lipomyces oligophaga TaxID=45792 RepID=UPI0034CE9148